jgi:hypothetical protein
MWLKIYCEKNIITVDNIILKVAVIPVAEPVFS